MTNTDLEYYRLRAEEERTRARATDVEQVARIHLELAEKYDALAKEAEQRPTLGAGWDDMSPA